MGSVKNLYEVALLGELVKFFDLSEAGHFVEERTIAVSKISYADLLFELLCFIYFKKYEGVSRAHSAILLQCRVQER